MPLTIHKTADAAEGDSAYLRRSLDTVCNPQFQKVTTPTPSLVQRLGEVFEMAVVDTGATHLRGYRSDTIVSRQRE